MTEGLFKWVPLQSLQPYHWKANSCHLLESALVSGQNLLRDEFHIFSSAWLSVQIQPLLFPPALEQDAPLSHSVDRIMSEKTHIVEDLGGFRRIFIYDTFTLNGPRVGKIANTIVSRGHNNLNIGVCRENQHGKRKCAGQVSC